ncbi:hypothetical protein Glove_557g51 [Diversispora epigaea]|uniref:Uncharacterized protein n=1 Tax=Diversispora epigaea TaxID=1348612 RepID=A0A397GB10_9GLOM|nr:hypothetical protein Glove_557g51 [Diversispora epigaea]
MNSINTKKLSRSFNNNSQQSEAERIGDLEGTTEDGTCSRLFPEDFVELIDTQEIPNRNNEVVGYNRMVESDNNNSNNNIIIHMLEQATVLSSSHDTQFEESFPDGSYISYQPSSLHSPHENF